MQSAIVPISLGAPSRYCVSVLVVRAWYRVSAKARRLAHPTFFLLNPYDLPKYSLISVGTFEANACRPVFRTDW